MNAPAKSLRRRGSRHVIYVPNLIDPMTAQATLQEAIEPLQPLVSHMRRRDFLDHCTTIEFTNGLVPAQSHALKHTLPIECNRASNPE